MNVARQITMRGKNCSGLDSKWHQGSMIADSNLVLFSLDARVRRHCRSAVHSQKRMTMVQGDPGKSMVLISGCPFFLLGRSTMLLKQSICSHLSFVSAELQTYPHNLIMLRWASSVQVTLCSSVILDTKNPIMNSGDEPQCSLCYCSRG